MFAKRTLTASSRLFCRRFVPRAAITASPPCHLRPVVAPSISSSHPSILLGWRTFADAVSADHHGPLLNRAVDDAEWSAAFEKATVGVAEMDPTAIDYATSAQRMRDLLRTGLLKHTDLCNNPERFFLAHRILAAHSSKVGPGFWVRFTVHYNLCAGTVLALGTPEQVQGLDTMQEKGELGCFALTEKLAGVSSGLVVNTVANWDAESQSFILHSPDEGAHKNWISQGLVADKTVVVADLRIDDVSYGPHAFLMYLRGSDGELIEGVSTKD